MQTEIGSSRSPERPLVAITLGDPSGIGPEISVKVFASGKLGEICRPIMIGDEGFLQGAIDLLGSKLKLHLVSSPKEAKFEEGTMDLIPVELSGQEAIQPGKATRAGGEAAYRFIERAIKLALAGQVDATTTNPISKEALHYAGHRYPGHTEIFGELTGAKEFCLMLVHDKFRIAHVSTHTSLAEACRLVRKERIASVIRLAAQGVREMGVCSPWIGVSALNPHAGEGGLFGREEIEEITPGVGVASREGIRVEGPIPPDTVFSRAASGYYDAVVAMYHDQGHIAFKVVNFRWDQARGEWESVRGVNVTLGLPIVRTSVDHGVAFDRAGKGSSSPESLAEAVQLAAAIARGRQEKRS